MFLFDWFSSVLNFFGLWSKSCKLVILGLDNAGKTTLLHRLKHDHFKLHAPTAHPTSESFTVEGLTVTVYDLGGHRQARRVWKEYSVAVSSIVFMLDSADEERFDESKAELYSLLSDELISDIPVVILSNKVDRKDAVSEEEIKRRFDLFGVLAGKDENNELPGRRPVELFMTSIVKRQGYGDGLRWLFSQIK